MYKEEITFVTGREVCGDQFFGRKILIKSIIARILAHNSVFLVGQRRIGKSSILRQLEYLNEHGKITYGNCYPILIRIDGTMLKKVNGYDDFAQLIARLLFNSIASIPPIEASMLHSIKSFLTKDFEEIIEEIERIKKKHGIFVVLLFDEYDYALRLEKEWIPGLIRYLISHGYLVAVCTSYHWPHELSEIKGIHSAWFNVFQVLEVNCFTRSEAFEMLQTLSEFSGYKFSDNECLFLCSVLGNHPFYLQLAGSRLFSDFSYSTCGLNKRQAILHEAVSLVIDDLFWHHDYLAEHLSDEQLKALKLVAKGRPLPNLSLIERRPIANYLIQTEDGFKINSEIFQHFILQLPDPIGDSSTKVFSRVTDFVKRSLEIAVKEAIAIATERYLK